MPVKPTPTPIELDKLSIDPDFDFRDVARRPFRDITSNEIGMFKWSGVYHQVQPGWFMLRLRVPGGVLTAEQLERAHTPTETTLIHINQADCIRCNACVDACPVDCISVQRVSVETVPAQGLVGTTAAAR